MKEEKINEDEKNKKQEEVMIELNKNLEKLNQENSSLNAKINEIKE